MLPWELCNLPLLDRDRVAKMKKGLTWAGSSIGVSGDGLFTGTHLGLCLAITDAHIDGVLRACRQTVDRLCVRTLFQLCAAQLFLHGLFVSLLVGQLARRGDAVGIGVRPGSREARRSHGCQRKTRGLRNS